MALYPANSSCQARLFFPHQQILTYAKMAAAVTCSLRMAAGNATGWGLVPRAKAIIRIILEYRHCQLLLHIMDFGNNRHHSTKQKLRIDT